MLDEALLTKLLCVGFVAAFMLPFGGLLFPYVSNELSGIEFQAIEAVASATLAFGIYSVLGRPARSATPVHRNSNNLVPAPRAPVRFSACE
jgi:hypothetical protein